MFSFDPSSSRNLSSNNVEPSDERKTPSPRNGPRNEQARRLGNVSQQALVVPPLPPRKPRDLQNAAKNRVPRQPLGQLLRGKNSQHVAKQNQNVHPPMGSPPGGRNFTYSRVEDVQNQNVHPPMGSPPGGRNFTFSRKEDAQNQAQVAIESPRSPRPILKRGMQKTTVSKRVQKEQAKQELKALSCWIQKLPQIATDRPIECKRPFVHFLFYVNTFGNHGAKWSLFLDFSSSSFGERAIQYFLWETTQKEGYGDLFQLEDVQLRYDTVSVNDLLSIQHKLHNSMGHAINPQTLSRFLGTSVIDKMSIGNVLSNCLFKLRDDLRTDANTRQRINEGVSMFQYEIGKTSASPFYKTYGTREEKEAPWALSLDFTETSLAIQEIQYLLRDIRLSSYKTKYLFKLSHIRLPCTLPWLSPLKPHAHLPNQDQEDDKIIPVRLKNPIRIHKQVNAKTFTTEVEERTLRNEDHIYPDVQLMVFHPERDQAIENGTSLDLWFEAHDSNREAVEASEELRSILLSPGILTPPGSPRGTPQESPISPTLAPQESPIFHGLSPQSSPKSSSPSPQLSPRSPRLSPQLSPRSPQLSPRHVFPQQSLRSNVQLPEHIKHVTFGAPSEIPNPDYNENDREADDGANSDGVGPIIRREKKQTPNELVQSQFVNLLNELKGHEAISQATKDAINNGDTLIHFKLSVNKSENRGVDHHLELWIPQSPFTTKELQLAFWKIIHMEGFEIKSISINNNNKINIEQLTDVAGDSIDPQVDIAKLSRCLYNSVTHLRFVWWNLSPKLLPYFNNYSNLEQLTFDRPFENENDIVEEQTVRQALPNIKKFVMKSPLLKGSQHTL